MGYVDAETMIEIRNKILGEIEEGDAKKENKLNRHVCCKMRWKFGITEKSEYVPGSGKAFEEPVFTRHLKYKQGSTYSIAVGNGKDPVGSHGFHKGNGNGFKAAPNDYLHQRKRYTGFYLDTSNGKTSPDWIDFFKFFFGEDLFDFMLESDQWEFGTSSWFPRIYTSRETRSIYFEFHQDFDEICDWIAENAIEGSFGLEAELNCSGHNINGEADDFEAFKGKIYIVENQFKRHPEESDPERFGYYCERVTGFLYLIVSINRTEQGWTRIYVSQISKK